MSLQAVQCEDCGGSVAFPENKTLPECPFCGSTKQIPKPIDRQVRPPENWIPFITTAGEADASFRVFAKSSFWYPKDIRHANLELKQILLPAWLWSGTVESHYNGLTRAASRSGYRPVSGEDTLRFSQIWVPASKALTLHELNAIAPFPKDNAQPLDSTPSLPYELGELTERIALKHAKQAMSDAHHAHIASAISLRQLRTSALHHQMEGSPGLVPIYIGVYRRKEKYYRVVINGATGKLEGDAPLDWIKISMVIGVIGLIMLIIANAA